MKTFTVNPIVNVVRAEIVTDESSPRVMFFDTISSAEPEPFVSEGEDTELRIRNTILAQDCLEDIIKGYDVTLNDCALSRELLEVVDGGESVTSASGVFAGYRSPSAGSASERTRFTLRLYTAEKDYGGDSVAYFRFSFPNCVGTPAKLSFENGSFCAPKYLVRSRPAAGGRAMSIECLDTLPVYCAAAGDVPASPAEGDCVIATADVSVGSLSLTAGEMAYYTGSAWTAIE